MNSDTIFQFARYLLMTSMGGLITKGVMTSDQQTAIVSGLIALGAWGWGFYVKWNTKTVTTKTASASVLPTVHPATGKVKVH